MKNFLLTFLLFFAGNAYSEVTNLEWTSWGDLVVTYYDAQARALEAGSCTAFNGSSAVGGQNGMFRGGVLRVSIQIPTQFQKSSSLRVTCRIERM